MKKLNGATNRAIAFVFIAYFLDEADEWPQAECKFTSMREAHERLFEHS